MFIGFNDMVRGCGVPIDYEEWMGALLLRIDVTVNPCVVLLWDLVG